MLINRDPFARQELHAEQITPSAGQTCDWCGNLNKRGKLFKYRRESDGGRKFDLRGAFCSVSCFRTYHEE